MRKNVLNKFAAGIVATVFLALCLSVTTFALVYESVWVRDNYFHTGAVKINLNDGEPVIRSDEFLFEPGMTVEKDFFIENLSTWEIYYKIYFKNVKGSMARALNVRVQDGEEVLFDGAAANFTRARTSASDDSLDVGERRNLKIFFHYPESNGNETQGLSLSFNLCAEAVQTKNNPEKVFD